MLGHLRWNMVSSFDWFQLTALMMVLIIHTMMWPASATMFLPTLAFWNAKRQSNVGSSLTIWTPKFATWRLVMPLELHQVSLYLGQSVAAPKVYLRLQLVYFNLLKLIEHFRDEWLLNSLIKIGNSSALNASNVSGSMCYTFRIQPNQLLSLKNHSDWLILKKCSKKMVVDLF